MKAGRKLIVSSLGVLGAAVLAAAGLASRDHIREKWHLWKLESGYFEERVAAARALGAMRSARSVEPLIRAMKRECVKDGSLLQHSETSEVFLEAFQGIGDRALPQALAALRSAGEDWAKMVVALCALDRIYAGRFPKPNPDEIDIQPLLEAIENDQALSMEVRETARETLRTLGY